MKKKTTDFVKKYIKKLPIIKQVNDIFTSIDIQLRDLQNGSNLMNDRRPRDFRIEGLNNIFLMQEQYKEEKLPINSKIALYTVITGDYDELKIPDVVEKEHFDYYCVTNNDKLASEFWNIIYIEQKNNREFQNLDNCKLARYVKTHPHVFFPKYEHTLFIDADTIIHESMYKWIATYSNNKDLLIAIHPLRDCIYEEGKECIRVNLDKQSIISNQLQTYRNFGYPAHNGLVMSNVIYRKNNDGIKNFDENWWKEIYSFSKRDQISFNFVLYKTRLDIAISPLNAFCNRYYEKPINHKSQIISVKSDCNSIDVNSFYKNTNYRVEQVKKAKSENKKIALYIYKRPDFSTFRYRCYNVEQATEKSSKWKAVYFYSDEIDIVKNLVKSIDILILCRVSWRRDIKDLVKECKKQNTKVLFDIDDNMICKNSLKHILDAWDVINDEHFYNFWFSRCSRLQSTAELADAFIVTNEFLGEIIKKEYKKPYKVIKNTLNKEQIESSKNSPLTKDEGFVIGYFSGSPSHNHDFKQIEDQILLFMNKHNDTKLRIVGELELSTKFDKFISKSRVEVVKKVNFIELQKLIGSVDVNIVPLVINEFTNSKSELKYFEAAITKVPTIASPSYTYSNSIKNEETGFICENNEWYDTFEKLYSNEKLRETIGNNAYKYCIEEYYGEKVLASIEETLDYFFNN